MTIYSCGCPGKRFTSAAFAAWNRLPHDDVVRATPPGQTPHPDGWPESWKFGSCSECEQEIAGECND